MEDEEGHGAGDDGLHALESHFENCNYYDGDSDVVVEAVTVLGLTEPVRWTALSE